MLDYSDLLVRARRMLLSEDEIDMVAQRLRDKLDPDREPTLMLVLGWAQAKQYEPEVAAVLKETSDTVSQKQALETLCFYWNLTPRYIEYVKRFVKTPPDEDRFPYSGECCWKVPR